MPVAFDTIEAKLSAGALPTLTSLESLVKRMVSNAKQYNERNSDIFKDSERIRKALSAFMLQKNPAYKIPGFTAPPTPIPGEKDATPVPSGLGSDRRTSARKSAGRSIAAAASPSVDDDAEGELEEVENASGKGSRSARNSSSRALHNPSSPAGNAKSAAVGFSGLTFQQAQEKIIVDIMRHKVEEE